MSKSLILAAFLFAFSALPLLRPVPVAALDEVLPVETLVVETSDGPRNFQVEVASNDHQRARGLMFRTEMAADAGMLFVFETEGDRYFWMKNTPLSLDIIFINDTGEIVHIAENTVPFSEDVIPSNGPSRYVLELLAGTSRQLGIAPGNRVTAPSMTR